MSTLSPFALARRQLELDRRVTERRPELFERKAARLLLSPHAFLRGSAPLFYEALRASPELAAGPAGEGFIVGDMHLENMGAYKADETKVVFDLNDFDDCGHAAWRFDALRLATSVILSGRALAAPALESIGFAASMLEAYVPAAFGGSESEPPPMAEPMVAIVDRAMKRSKKDLLDARAPISHGTRGFVRGDRYAELTADQQALALSLLPLYVAALGERAPQRAGSWQIVDIAQRIAGTGSLGRLRFAVLVRDETGDERILDFKEAAPSSVDQLLDGPLPPADPVRRAERVVAGARALVERPPRLLAAIPAPHAGLSFIGRQLCPQEDKLDVARLSDPSHLRDIAARAGFMLGSAHARGAAQLNAPKSPAWSDSERGGVLDRAVELAGLFEAVYLAYARLAATP